jgi:hypothetical protein
VLPSTLLPVFLLVCVCVKEWEEGIAARDASIAKNGPEVMCAYCNGTLIPFHSIPFHYPSIEPHALYDGMIMN